MMFRAFMRSHGFLKVGMAAVAAGGVCYAARNPQRKIVPIRRNYTYYPLCISNTVNDSQYCSLSEYSKRYNISVDTLQRELIDNMRNNIDINDTGCEDTADVYNEFSEYIAHSNSSSTDHYGEHVYTIIGVDQKSDPDVIVLDMKSLYIQHFKDGTFEQQDTQCPIFIGYNLDETRRYYLETEPCGAS